MQKTTVSIPVPNLDQRFFLAAALFAVLFVSLGLNVYYYRTTASIAEDFDGVNQLHQMDEPTPSLLKISTVKTMVRHVIAGTNGGWPRPARPPSRPTISE